MGVCQAFEKTYDEMYTLLNRIIQSNLEWQDDVSRSMVKKPTSMIKCGKKPTSMIEVDSIIALAVQLAFFQNQMISQFNKLSVTQPQAQVNTVKQVQNLCKIYGSNGHSIDYVEQIQSW